MVDRYSFALVEIVVALVEIMLLAAIKSALYPARTGYAVVYVDPELFVIIFSTSENRVLKLVLAVDPSAQAPLNTCDMLE